MRKQLLIKIAIAVLVVLIAVSSVIIYNKLHNPTADVGGGVTVELVDLEGNVKVKQLDFEEGYTLERLMSENYKLTYKDDQYGTLLLGIDDIQTDFVTTYIAIYIDEEYSNYGLSSIQLKEGSTYSFRETRV